jgi:tensin
MNSSPLFLHYVLVPMLPAFEPGTSEFNLRAFPWGQPPLTPPTQHPLCAFSSTPPGFQPFLKIYQSMQLVYTSGV